MGDDRTTARQTRTLTLHMRDDGILCIAVVPEVRQSLEDAHENLECARELTRGERVPVLMDIRQAGGLGREIRSRYIDEGAAGMVGAMALVADSQAARVLGDLFARLAKTSYPAEVFTTIADAIEWLNQQRF